MYHYMLHSKTKFTYSRILLIILHTISCLKNQDITVRMMQRKLNLTAGHHTYMYLAPSTNSPTARSKVLKKIHAAQLLKIPQFYYTVNITNCTEH